MQEVICFKSKTVVGGTMHNERHHSGWLVYTVGLLNQSRLEGVSKFQDLELTIALLNHVPETATKVSHKAKYSLVFHGR